MVNKGVLITAGLATFLAYTYVANQPDPDAPSKGSILEAIALEFLEYVGGAIAGDIAVRGIWNLAKQGAAKLRARGVVTAAEKAAIAEAEKGAITAAEKAGVNAAEDAAIKAADKAAIETAGTAAEKAALTEAEKLAEKEAIALAEQDALKAAEKAALGQAEQAAIEQAEKAAISEAEQEAIRLAEKEAIALAEQEAIALAEKEAIALAEKEALLAAEKLAIEAAEGAAISAAEKATARAASLGAKAAGMMDSLLSGPAGWIMLAITTTLYTVLGLDPSMFAECKEGYFDPSTMPAWLQGILGAIPVLGDLFSLLGGLLCIREGCPEGHINRAGLCHPPCPEGWKDDGASMCYKQYGEYWENKGFPAAPTITSVTKTVLTNTGVPYSKCESGEEMDAGLCYDRARPGYTGVGPVVWATLYDTPPTAVELEDCPAGWDTLPLTCQEPIGWNDNCVWWDWGALGGYYTGCATGGGVVGRLDHGGKCPSGKEYVDGMCYDTCPTFPSQECHDEEQDEIACNTVEVPADPNNMWMPFPTYRTDCLPTGNKVIRQVCTDTSIYTSRVPGMPYVCRTNGDISYTRGVGGIPACGDGQTEDSLGLCYNQPPEGFVKSTLGMMEDVCPAGSTDFGVGCTRESTFDVGGVPVDIYVKTRESYYGITEGLPAGF